jgi:hypothetical protein
MRYLLSDFQSYLKNNEVEELPIETNNIIMKLASEVGAPEYIKTPQFKQSFNNNFHRRRKKTGEILNDNDWDSIRNFQTTEFNKCEGLDINLHKVRKSLNILTNKNYSKILNEISEQFDMVASTKTPNDVLVLSKLIYDIVSTNVLYSTLCAELFKDLLDKSINLKNLLNQNLNDYENKIYNITYTDPEIDYDKFCENNKNNEKIRAEFLFFTNLMKNNIINYTVIDNIIINFFNILYKFVEEGNKKNEIDELSEIIYIVINNSYDIIKSNDIEKYKLIYSHIEKIANMKVKQYPGITNKCIFKHMDLHDELSS